MCPEVPLVAAPDENDSSPLTPLPPAFTDLMRIRPVDFCVDDPEDNDTVPPMFTALEPPFATTSPPVSVALRAATALMLPLRPFALFPEEKVILPDAPELDVPDVKRISPLTPLVPASLVTKIMLPLLFGTLAPLVTEMLPPEAAVL